MSWRSRAEEDHEHQQKTGLWPHWDGCAACDHAVEVHDGLVKALEGMIAAWHTGGAELAIQDAEHALAKAKGEA